LFLSLCFCVSLCLSPGQKRRLPLGTRNACTWAAASPGQLACGPED
jgi:hypothetical protein